MQCQLPRLQFFIQCATQEQDYCETKLCQIAYILLNYAPQASTDVWQTELCRHLQGYNVQLHNEDFIWRIWVFSHLIQQHYHPQKNKRKCVNSPRRYQITISFCSLNISVYKCKLQRSNHMLPSTMNNEYNVLQNVIHIVHFIPQHIVQG